MNVRRPPRWLSSWLVFMLLLALLASVAPALAQPPARAADRILAALGQPAAAPMRGATAAAHAVGTRPIYPIEGPVPRVNRGQPASPPLLSLADQRDPKQVARLALDRDSGTPGSSVRITGRGYAPGQRVDLYWDGANVTGRRLVTAGDDGRFTWSFNIPQPMTDGAHTIAALESKSAATNTNLIALADQLAGTHSQATFTVTGGLPAGAVLPSLSLPSAPAAQVARPNLQTQSAAAVKAWTFAVYIAGDNSLSDATDYNLNQMIAAGGTNANVNIVALHDKQNAATKYWEVTGAGLADRTPANITGNINTGRPEAFVNFMAFVAQNYPAQHYAVVIWNHGGGWKGIESDDPSGDLWSMADLRGALQASLQQLGRQRYDVLIFDACLMAQYEVGLEIKPFVDIMVGSEETIPGEGTPYDRYLAPTLVSNPATTAASFSTRVVDEYAAFYTTPEHNHPEVTLTAITLGATFDTFRARLDAFANALLAVAPTAAGDIQLARDATHSYTDASYIDLGDFAAKIKARIPDANVQASANALIAALAPTAAGPVLRETHGPQSAGSQGISVYMPSPNGQAAGGNGFDTRYEQLQVKNTAWFTFVKAFYTGQYPGSPPPTDTPPPPPPPASSSSSDIVYASHVGPAQFDLNRIESVASAGSTAETFALLSDRNRNSYPRWSADGKYVVYASDRSANPNSRTGYELNLFLIGADGKPPAGASGPVQLTFSAVNCLNGPGTGAPCTVEQSYDPAWLPDNTGILYTKLLYDMSNYPDVGLKQSIQLINLALTPGQAGYDSRILPDRDLGDDVQFANADFNGSLLLFTYTAPTSYGADLASNHIGFIDLSGAQPVKSYIALNTPADIASGNYLLTNYPAFRPGANEFAFLYTRVGDPTVMQGIDPRIAPDAGELENPYDTYDVGRMSLTKIGAGTYQFSMESPIWPFQNAGLGVGVNYRPSWRPDGSGNLTASVSTDGGSTYNVGLFLNVLANNGADSRVFLITDDGYSYLPSWGHVSAANIQARLEVKPPYLEPGPSSNYYLAGSGFAPNETIQLTRAANAIGTVKAGADGTFEVALKLTPGTPAGPISYSATGSGSGKHSNQAVLVVLSPRNGPPGAPGSRRMYLPLTRR